MITSLCVLLALPCSVPALPLGTAAADTVRLEVGAKQVNGRVYAPHAARVRVRVGTPDSPIVSEWTNELTIGDSAGRKIMRWVTKGTRQAPAGGMMTWELRQTYDAVTLAPYGYHSTSSIGGFQQLTLDGTRVRGSKRIPGDSTVQQVDVTLDRPGFVASASDLLPAAVGFKEGLVILAPFWSPAMTKSEMRVFTVVGKTPMKVEGTDMVPWKVTEHRQSDGKLLATWYLLDSSPYMVYGEVPMPNGQTQLMSEVAIPMSK